MNVSPTPELISAGLNLLNEQDETMNGLRREILTGFEAIQRGEFVDYDEHSIQSLADKVKARGRQRLAESLPSARVR